MKQLILISSLFIASSIFGQDKLDKSKAETSVSKYMSVNNKNYKVVSFGEFFEQTDTQGIEEKLKTKEKIKYSLVHTYIIGSTKITNMYFHLDEKYKVIGKMPFKEMEQMMLKENSSKLDSIMSGLPGM